MSVQQKRWHSLHTTISVVHGMIFQASIFLCRSNGRIFHLADLMHNGELHARAEEVATCVQKTSPIIHVMGAETSVIVVQI